MHIIYEFQQPSKTGIMNNFKKKNLYSLMIGKKGFSLFSDTITPWTGDGHYSFDPSRKNVREVLFLYKTMFCNYFVKIVNQYTTLDYIREKEEGKPAKKLKYEKITCFICLI